MRAAVCAVAMFLSLSPPAYSQQKDTPAVPAGVISAERKPTARTADFVGRVEARERVQIVARVTGFLEAVQFQEGGTVKKGDVLYRIEKGLFQAAVQQAKGALERSKAETQFAELQLKRAETLLQRDTGTEVRRDQTRASFQQGKAAILANQANLDTANINLGYTDITAPIAGRIGRTSVTVGNVVGPQSGALTTIVSIDPIYVTFPVSQREIMRARQELQQTDLAGIKAELRFADGGKYGRKGTINFVDVTVAQATDTVTVRASFPNPEGALIDGQLVRVNLESTKQDEKIVIPQSALLADQQGTYVFVVEDGKAALRRVKTGGERGGGAVIDEGLSPGDQVIVEGLQAIRPGVPVQPFPAQLPLSAS